MSRIIQLDELFENIDFFINEALNWKIFIYPTDTIYWIWWIFPLTLEKIYDIKKRDYSKKASVIWPWEFDLSKFPIYTPDVKEILLDIRNNNRGWTLVWKLKEEYLQKYISYNIFNEIYKDWTLWIRIVKHKIQDFVNKLWFPFISTSANISWEKNIESINDIKDEIRCKVDYIIDWWILSNPPSVIVDVTDWIKIISR